MTIGNRSNVSEPPTAPGGRDRAITRSSLLLPERRATFHLARLAGSRHDRAELSPAVDLRTALLEAATAAADAAERARSLANALDEALADLTAEQAVSPETSSPMVDLLSPREQEVLALVADGCTNKAIAATLFVSPNTVKTHVTSLLHKLRANTRVQLAAIATRQGLLGRSSIDPIRL